jgi:hypothetical protein
VRYALALLLAAAFAAPVAADTPEKAAAFMGAMRDANCDLSLEAADDAAEALGITTDELDEIIDLLFFGGQIFVDVEEHMTMTATLCAALPAEDAALFVQLQAEIDLDAMEAAAEAGEAGAGLPTPDRAALVMAAIRANDCGIARAEAEEVLGAAGIGPVEAYRVTAILYDAGMLGRGAIPGALHLTDDICLGDPGDDAALYELALERLDAAEVMDPDAVIVERFGPEGVRAVLEFMADDSGCVLDISDRAATVDAVVAFLAFNLSGVHNLPADVSPEAEAELRATVDAMLDDPGPAFAAGDGQLILIDCTP